MDLSELNSLEPDNIGSWPLPVRGFILLVIFCLVLGAAYYFSWMKEWENYKSIQAKEPGLWKELEEKQKKAVSLAEYEKKLQTMRDMLKDMVGRLPEDIKVDSFVRDISLSGKASYLEFDLIQPGSEKKVASKHIDGVYELPVTLSVKGDFHKFGDFVERVSRLPRIINMGDFQITAASKGQYQLKAVAKTYRHEKEGGKQ